MNNLMAALFERMAAVWIERIAGSKLTTIAGILGIAATFVSQLTTYIPAHYSPYVAMTGVVVAGVAAILAKDADAPHGIAVVLPKGGFSNSTAKLGALMLCAILVTGTLPMAGCNGATVAQNIVNWTPALQSGVAVVDSTASVLDPAAAPIFAAATVGFDAASNVLVAQAKAYLANPNATVLAQLQTAVVTFQQQVNTALLSVARITNPSSQQKAQTDINAVATVVNTILALVQGISSKAAVAQMAAQSTVKLAAVMPYLNQDQAAQIVAVHYGDTTAESAEQTRQALANLQGAGF
jgi:hypothetical protein